MTPLSLASVLRRPATSADLGAPSYCNHSVFTFIRTMAKGKAKRVLRPMFPEEQVQEFIRQRLYPTITLPPFPTTASLFNLGAVRKRVREEVHEARAMAEEDENGAGPAVVDRGQRAGKLRRKRVPKAPALKWERVWRKLYRMRSGMGRNGPWELRVWRPDLSEPKWYCVHDRKKNNCKKCGGASICHHNRQRFQCKVPCVSHPRKCTIVVLG